MRQLMAAVVLLAASGLATAADPMGMKLDITVVEDPNTTPRTVKVKSVTVGGTADQMGIRPGDIIQSVNKVEITSSKDLTETLKKNTSVSVVWKSGDKRYRNTAMMSVTTPVGKPPEVVIGVGKKAEIAK